jgi:hypothetical protein
MARASKTQPALRSRLVIFAVLLVVAVGFVIALGAGAIEQNVVGNYVVYILVGALAAVLTFGILSSTGEIAGERHGFSIKVTGSLVALLAVAGGGVWLDLQRRDFVVKLKLVGGDGGPVRATGKARLEFLGRTPEASINGSDLVTFEAIPASAMGAEASVSLDSPGLRLAHAVRFQLRSDSLVEVAVTPAGTPRLTGTVRFKDGPLAGAALAVAGTSCAGQVDGRGYFDIECPSVKLPALVRLEAPRALDAVVCQREFTLTTATGNDLVVPACSEPAGQGTAARRQRRPCGGAIGRMALVNAVQSLEPRARVTVSASIGPSGRFRGVVVREGPPEYAGRIEGRMVEAASDCAETEVTVTVPAVH